MYSFWAAHKQSCAGNQEIVSQNLDIDFYN